MSYQMPWYHRHVYYESRQIIAGFNNSIIVMRSYRETVITDCPYGFNCPMIYPYQINLWATPQFNPLVPQLNPQLSPTPQPLRQPVWLSNDIYNFNVPSSAFPNEMRIKPIVVDNNRGWEHTGDGNNLHSHKTMRIQLMSYNVLSRNILDSNHTVYNLCTREDLLWEARWEKIFNEVSSLDPDIFCLQEVQLSHLSCYARFERIGYEGVFKKKTRYNADGCAVFYKSSMFEMIERVAVEFRCEEIPFLRADSVGIIMKLAPRASPNTHLVVATTHLPYMPGETATRLAQMRILLREIEKFSYDEVRGQLPVILTGDFNALAESNVIKFLEEGQIRIPVKESLESIGFHETYVGVNVGDETNGDTAGNYQIYKLATHPFKLSSVYDKRQGKWITVDHIYFSHDLRLVKRLAPPNRCMRREIPNERYGCDHMSTSATLEMVIE